jgi:hypothetical protein
MLNSRENPDQMAAIAASLRNAGKKRDEPVPRIASQALAKE